ncbi:nicotinate-nucleotide adenylyltransferase [Bacillota bacterium Meth-B3]|nr:nicotinate-nucleotide adenylyltransferase [Christensenellaceae bacterium]
MGTIGILGGTFDPIHLGHLKMAEAATRQLSIGRMLFIPDGDPPHKGTQASAEDRLNMVVLAIQGRPGFEASDVEVKRAGVTYTLDTLRSLRASEPDADFCYVVGADTLLTIETWHAFDEVASLLRMLVLVPRPGTPDPLIKSQMACISGKYRLDIRMIGQPVSNLSSTEVRQRAARHESLALYVPEPVERYIKARKLYHDPMLETLRHTMTPARYRHTLGVERMAVRLAQLHGVDVEQARLAALLHDCAKHMQVAEMAALVAREGIALAAGEGESRALLHAAAGTALAREQFHVTDGQVLDAIRWHTTGRVGMTALDKVIYLADMTEENRRAFPGLNEIREAAEVDLDQAMAIAARRTVDYVRTRGMPLNERTLELLESIKNDRM